MYPENIGAYFCYDPRDLSQSVGDRSTWKLSQNAVLISATMLLCHETERTRINWERVAALACLCDCTELHPEKVIRPGKLASRSETDAMIRAALHKAKH